MGMTINQDGKIRQVSSFEKGKVLRDGKLRSISIIKVKMGEVLYTVWELIVSTFLGKDGLPFYGKGDKIPFMGKD